MTKELLNEIQNDYWNEKADPIDMAEVFDLAIKALEQEQSGKKTYKSEARRWKRRYLDLKQRIFKLEEQTKWIPVSERLPEREGWYLISLGDKTYGGADVDMYCDGWVKYGTHGLAWMPLPQPYKAESEDEE